MLLREQVLKRTFKIQQEKNIQEEKRGSREKCM